MLASWKAMPRSAGAVERVAFVGVDAHHHRHHAADRAGDMIAISAAGPARCAAASRARRARSRRDDRGRSDAGSRIRRRRCEARRTASRRPSRRPAPAPVCTAEIGEALLRIGDGAARRGRASGRRRDRRRRGTRRRAARPARGSVGRTAGWQAESSSSLARSSRRRWRPAPRESSARSSCESRASARGRRSACRLAR